MKFHIVRTNETIKEIINIYSLTMSELKENNRHVRDWNKLIPGTKLKIPIINQAVEQEIIDMEPFIEDYYPRNNIKDFNNEEKEVIKKEEIIHNHEMEVFNEDVEDIKEKNIEKEIKEEVIKENNINTQEYKNNKQTINYSYIWYYPYPVYYPIYIKVK